MSTRDEYADQIKSAFATIGKEAAMKFIVAKLPFFGNMFLNPILGFFVAIVIKALVESGEMGLFFMYIDMRTGEQSKDFQEAAKENYQAQKSGTDEEKRAAADKLRQAFRAFASLHN